MKIYKRLAFCLPFVAVLTVLSGCDVEPEFWEVETYEAQGKPEGIEYMFCGLGSKLVEVNVDEGTAEVIDVSSTDTVALSMSGYDELPVPGYVEERLTLSKAYSGLYRASIVVTEIKIQGCALPKRLNARVSLAFNEESKIWRLEQETEDKVYIDNKERLNTNCQWQYIQSTMEDSIPYEKRDYFHSNSNLI